MSYKININRVEIFDDLILDEANEIKLNQDVKYIQISKEVPRQILEMINSVILSERSDIQFRVYGFYGAECNLSFLEGLTNVVNLSIGEMRSVNNLDILGKLVKLQRLRVHLDKLDDISFLSNLNSNLISLMLGTGLNNSNLDIGIIEEFQELESLFLYKINCGYNSLKNMKVLKSLTMNACNIDEFSFLEETNINNLSVGMMNISDLSSLNGNKKIKKLELQRLSRLSDLDLLSNLPNLEYCNVSNNNHIEKVPDMRRCDGIKELIFDCIKNLSDISELIYIPNIERIEMYQLKLVDLSVIEEILRKSSLKKLICTTGSIKKDRQITELIEKYGKL